MRKLLFFILFSPLLCGLMFGEEGGGLSENLSVGAKNLLKSYQSRYGFNLSEVVASRFEGKEFLLFEIPSSGSRIVYFYSDEADDFKGVEQIVEDFFGGDYVEFYLVGLPSQKWKSLLGLLHLSFASEFSLSDGVGDTDPASIVIVSFFNGKSIRRNLIEEGVRLFRKTSSGEIELNESEKDSLFFLMSAVEYLAINGHCEVFKKMRGESLVNLYIDVNEVSLLEYIGDRYKDDYQRVLFQLLKSGKLPD